MCFSNPTAYQVEKRLENIKELAQTVRRCPTCQKLGVSNKWVNHMKNCDGTGPKNYWSKKRSELLEAVVLGLATVEEVGQMVEELKEEARIKRDK